MCCLTLSVLQNHRQPDMRGPRVPEPPRGRGSKAALVRLLLVQEGWGCLGSGGRPCLTPTPNVPPTPSRIRGHSINPCLRCDFQNSCSHSPPGCRPPTRGPEWSQQQVRDCPRQTLPAPTGKRGCTHTPGALSGGPHPKGMGQGGPHGEAWEPDTGITWRGFSSIPRRPHWGRSPLHPHPAPLTVPSSPPC